MLQGDHLSNDILPKISSDFNHSQGLQSSELPNLKPGEEQLDQTRCILIIGQCQCNHLIRYHILTNQIKIRSGDRLAIDSILCIRSQHGIDVGSNIHKRIKYLMSGEITKDMMDQFNWQII